MWTGRIARYLALLFIVGFIYGISVIAAYHVVYRNDAPESPASGRQLARYEWPDSLVEFVRDANRNDIWVEQLRVYSGPHDNCFWTFHVTPKLLEMMISRWQLSVVDRNNRYMDIALKYMPASLSALTKEHDVVEYYVSAELLPGGCETGHQYCVAHNKTSKIVIVRYYYNF